jgi:threonine dehydrogenase-like Zn-dependent dehydrogenase
VTYEAVWEVTPGGFAGNAAAGLARNAATELAGNATAGVAGNAAGFNGVFLFSGNPEHLAGIFSLTEPGAAILVASARRGSPPIAVPLTALREREIRFAGVLSPDRRDVRDAVRALDQRVVDSESLVSRRLRWEEGAPQDLDANYFRHGLHVVLAGPALDQAP